MSIDRLIADYRGRYCPRAEENTVYMRAESGEPAYLVMVLEGRLFVGREFLYDSEESALSTWRKRRELLLEAQRIEKSHHRLDLIVDEQEAFCSERIGFHVDTGNWDRAMESLYAFELLLEAEDGELDLDYIGRSLPEELGEYLEAESWVGEELEEVCLRSHEFDFDRLSGTKPQFGARFEELPVFGDAHGTIVVGFGASLLELVGEHVPLPAAQAEAFYLGQSYFMARSHNAHVVANATLVREVLRIFDAVSWDGMDQVAYAIQGPEQAILITSGALWALIAPVRTDLALRAMEEREHLRRMGLTLNAFIPAGRAGEVYLFDRLDAGAFERLCRDLLVEVGFQNVRMRGSTNAADNGVDLEADEERTTLFGTTEIRRWIFQCKHTRAQYGRADAAEIPQLVREFGADCYGLFYSGTFTPQTLDRLGRLACRVQWWGKDELETLLDRYKRVSVRYFGV